MLGCLLSSPLAVLYLSNTDYSMVFKCSIWEGLEHLSGTEMLRFRSASDDWEICSGLTGKGRIKSWRNRTRDLYNLDGF